MDITRLIEDDHAEQRQLFALIDDIPDSETGALTAVWKRLCSMRMRRRRSASSIRSF